MLVATTKESYKVCELLYLTLSNYIHAKIKKASYSLEIGETAWMRLNNL